MSSVLKATVFPWWTTVFFALQLVQSGLTPATLFLANGQVAQAADVLYKRPIVLMRGSFNPVCNLHLEVMAQVKKNLPLPHQ